VMLMMSGVGKLLNLSFSYKKSLRSDCTVRISSTEVKFFPMGITFDLE
jgi:hypothetical protein